MQKAGAGIAHQSDDPLSASNLARCTGDATVLGVRVELELERRLDQLAQQLGITRSACIREAISQVLSRQGAAASAMPPVGAQWPAGSASLE